MSLSLRGTPINRAPSSIAFKEASNSEASIVASSTRISSRFSQSSVTFSSCRSSASATRRATSMPSTLPRASARISATRALIVTSRASVEAFEAEPL